MTKRAVLHIAIIGLICALATVRRDYRASFEMDLGREISPEALPCSAPDVSLISHLIVAPKIWAQYVAPGLRRGLDSDRIREGCAIDAGKLEVIGWQISLRIWSAPRAWGAAGV